jgi:EpsI family protein
MKNAWLKNFILLALMLSASGLALTFRPTHKIADQRPAFKLETIPHTFGEWREEPQSLMQIINPQQQEFIQEIYKQTLSRTYVNAAGYRIMLSLAYVESQSDSFGVHLPEVCYPAQGFQMGDRFAAQIKTSQKTIPVERMVATMGARVEPITYWVTVGDQIAAGPTERKLAQIRFAFHGNIPDGMLVRISSIGVDTASAYAAHARFVNDFEAALPRDLRTLLFGQIGRT